MTFEQDVVTADEAIRQGCLDLVVNTYRPLFEKIKKKAVEHLNAESVQVIDLHVRSGLVFRNDGQFYNGRGKPVELQELPRIYQEESDYIAGCADSRFHTTPSVHSAMNTALLHFRERVKKSLASVL